MRAVADLLVIVFMILIIASGFPDDLPKFFHDALATRPHRPLGLRFRMAPEVSRGEGWRAVSVSRDALAWHRDTTENELEKVQIERCLGPA